MKGINLSHDDKRAAKGQAAYVVRVDVMISGKRYAPTKFYATDAAARVGLANAEAEVTRLRAAHDPAAKPEPPKPDTLAAYAATWLEIKTKLKPATAYSYEIAFRLHINPVPLPTGITLGATPLPAITLDTIDAFRAYHTKRGTGSATLRRIMLTLGSCLGFAASRGKIAANPCARQTGEIGSADDEQPEPNPLSPDAAAAFLTWARTHAAGWSLWFLFLIRTGARIGEASALRWDLVDFDRKVATIKFSFSPVAKRRNAKGLGDGPTKTWRQREVELSDELIDALRDERARQRKAALAAGLPSSPYVFLTPARGVRVLTNNPTIATVFGRGMTAIGRAASEHSQHDLRDTFATMHLLADPRRLLWISATLGHKNPQITLTRYSKWVKTLESAGFASAFDGATAGAKGAIVNARK